MLCIYTICIHNVYASRTEDSNTVMIFICNAYFEEHPFYYFYALDVLWRKGYDEI